MKHKYWIAIVVLVTLAVASTVGWAANVYWRNNRYQLPRTYQSRVIETILTDHKRDLDGVVAAVQALTTRVASLETRMTTAEANIATNAANIASNTGRIAALEGRVTTAEGNIADNTADIVAISPDEPLRIMRGRVAGDGTILEGSGFTVLRFAAGQYNIYFSTPFADRPSAAAITENNHVVTEYGTLATVLFVDVEDHSGTPVDQEFSFVVIGGQ